MNHTCLTVSVPVEAGTHLPTRERWKAELALAISGGLRRPGQHGVAAINTG